MKRMVMCLLVLMLVGICPVSVKAQTPGQSFVNQKIADKAAKQAKLQAANLKVTMYKAIVTGNRSVVQSLIAADKNRVYLLFPMPDAYGNEYAYCTAARYGQTAILQDMAALFPAVLQEPRCNSRTVLDSAIQNKQWNTAKWLFAQKAPIHKPEEDLFSLTDVADKTVLQTMIRHILAANPDQTYEECLRCPDIWDTADPFYFAARNSNVNFITIFRNEQKKKGKQIKSTYTYVDCDHRYRTSWGISQEESEKTRKDGINKIKKSKEAKLLAANGIPVDVKLQVIDNESYCY